MSDTLKSLRAEIVSMMRGDYELDSDTPVVNACINNAIESIWTSMIQVRLAKFFGVDSPVTFTLGSGVERVQLVSIQDPTVAPVVNQVAGGALADAAVFSVGYTFVTE